MAVTVRNYGLFLQSLLEGRVNLTSDEVWAILVSDTYVFNQNAHKFRSSVTGEIIGSGYAPGGKKVAFTSPTYSSIEKSVSVPAGNVAWPTLGANGIIGAVLYVKRQGIPEASMPLFSYIDFGQTVNRNNQPLYINFPASGIIKLVTT